MTRRGLQPHILPAGPALIVANHSGGLPYDGAMLIYAFHSQHPEHRALRTLVANFAGVDDGGMADGDPVANDAGEFVGEMEDGVVLNVGMMANFDAIDVAAQDGVEPDARMHPERHIAQHHRAIGDEYGLAERRFFMEKGA